MIARMHGEGAFRVFNDLFHQNELEPGVQHLEEQVKELAAQVGKRNGKVGRK